MKHNCPHCEATFKYRLLRSKALPGQRRFLPERATSACPECGGQIALNTHWSEIVAGGAVVLPVLFYMQRRPALETASILWPAGALLICMGAMFAVFYFRYWRNWQRYKAYVP